MKTRFVGLLALLIMLVAWGMLGYAESQGADSRALTTPLYSNIAFWQWMVSLSALFLSLVPYLRSFVKGTRISLHLLSRLSLTHMLGYPNVQLYLAIQNTGGRPVRIQSIILELQKDGRTYRLRAQQYYPNDTEATAALLPPIRLIPDHDWSHAVLFTIDLPREDEIRLRTIVSNIKTNIQNKIPAIPPVLGPGQSPPFYEADAEVLEPSMKFFDNHFVWSTGEYVGKVIVQTDPAKAITSSTFRFTLFESESNSLRDYRNDYKYGLGIYFFNAEKQPGISIVQTPA